MEKLAAIQSSQLEKTERKIPTLPQAAKGIAAPEIEFSKHLLERINRRQLRIGPDETQKLSKAIDKAESKGSRDSLVLLNDLALIVSVSHRKVVTAIDKNKLSEGIFTNIDSAIIM